jgi:addiction module antidote protein, HigA family
METSINELVPFKATHPGEILREELKERGIKQKDFAASIGMQATHLNEFIKGRRDITPELALKLENELGISYDFWMNLQKGYLHDTKAIEKKNADEKIAISTEREYSEIVNLSELYKRFSIDSVSASRRLEKLKTHFHFNIKSLPEREKQVSGFYKHSEKVQIDEKNLRTWLALVWAETEKVALNKDYTEGNAKKAAKDIAEKANKQALTTDFIAECLEENGIAYEVVPKLDKTPVDGYSLMAPGHHPAVIVTYRYNDLDKLAFDVLHELGHIELHLNAQNEGFISIEGYSESEEEREANSFANDALIPPAVWESIMNSHSDSILPHAIAKIIAREAIRNGISPSIAVARYKHESNCYDIKAYRSPKIH